MIRCIFYLFVILLLIFASVPDHVSAQQNGEVQEVYLSFRYQNTVSRFVTAYYREGEFFLPHNELFQILQIDAETDLPANTVSGQFLDEGQYTVNYQNGTAMLGSTNIELNADQFLLKELDYYLHPDIFYELFGLDFIVDFSNVALMLETDKTVPVVAQRERELQRERAMRSAREISSDYYPLQFDRNRQIFNAGFIDYNLSANITPSVNSYLFSTSLGSELLGGDLQGNIHGSWSRSSSAVQSNNLRWRYGIHNNRIISGVTAGQTTSESLNPFAYSGIRVTNHPIEPRVLFDNYTFSGTTTPDSEVELYRNNSLIDFQRADDTGQYNFNVPLTYGSSQYNLRMFSPTGQIAERHTRLQVPFNFVPPGKVNYTVEAGHLDNPLFGSTERGFMGNARVSTGVTNWLSATGGVEYFDEFHQGLPTMTGSLAGRFLSKYLVSLDVAGDAFYRMNTSVTYFSGVNFQANYTRFLKEDGLYNPGRNTSRLGANLFTPFHLGELPLFFRTSVTYDQRSNSEVTRYRFDLNSRFDNINLRVGFRDTQIGDLQWTTTTTSRLTGSVTYNVARGRTVPPFFRGLYVRSQLIYMPRLERLDELQFQLSRSLFGDGRIQITGGRNFNSRSNYFNLSLSFNFHSMRTNTAVRSTRGSSSMNQSLRGSVGYDSSNNHTTFTNRQQVGRAAVAVRMFVDRNDSGTFDEGDELLPDNAIRIERAGGSIYNEEGISYITQLQPYRRYNLTVNKSAIRNPLLVPETELFSIITDPNQYKPIDIPVTMSGVIEGRIERVLEDGSTSGLAGIRLFLTRTDQSAGTPPFRQELRTFSDGSYYAYEIPPGTYELEIDPSQLQFLDARSSPETLEFDVAARYDGDFLSGLNLQVVPDEENITDPEDTLTDDLASEEDDRDPDDRVRGESSSVDQVPGDDLQEGKILTGDLSGNQVPAGEAQAGEIDTGSPEMEMDIPPFPHGALPDYILQVDTLQSDMCRYTIQIGSYKTISKSLAAAIDAETRTGHDMNIYQNLNTGLFAVRTTGQAGFSHSVALSRQIDTRVTQNDVSVVSQCYDDRLYRSLRPVEFHVQLGAFSERTNAENLMQAVYRQYGLDIFVEESAEQSFFRVKMGPFGRDRAFAVADSLKGRKLTEDHLVTPVPAGPENNLGFDYRIQAGTWQTRKEAFDAASSIHRNSGYRSYILIDEAGNYNLFLDISLTGWPDVLDTREKFYKENSGSQPVIHLIEKMTSSFVLLDQFDSTLERRSLFR